MANRIDRKLEELKKAGRTALVPFLTVGYPDVETSKALAEVIIESGGDILELGIPFSDPLAEGLTVQKTSFRALEHGVNLDTSLELVRYLRNKGVEAPLIFMGYYNTFLHYGVEAFVRAAHDAGLDGVIVVDLPTEESGPFKELCRDAGIYLIPLLAPTSTDQRIARACKDANGFIYCVSLTGVTGARNAMAGDLPELVRRIRLHTDLPVLMGFGISSREHVEAVGRFADGAVVGSALLEAIGAAPPGKVLEAASDFIRGLSTPATTEHRE